MIESVMSMLRTKLGDARRHATHCRNGGYKPIWEQFLSEDRAVIIYLFALVSVYGSKDQQIEAQGIDNETKFLRFKYQEERDA